MLKMSHHSYKLDLRQIPELEIYFCSLESRLQSEAILSSEDIDDLIHNELIFDKEHITQLNNEVRSVKSTWIKGDKEETFWTDDFLIIGQSGCGDFYFLSASRSFLDVRFYDHEAEEISTVANHISEYYNYILQDLQNETTKTA